jgi:membrane-associated phospholipid phosphatase
MSSLTGMVPESNRQKIRRAEVVAVLGGSAVLAGTWVVVAVNHGVPGWEQDIFEWVNDLPDALWPVVWGPMQVGSLAGSLVVVAVTFVATRQRRLTLTALAASQVAWWSAKLIKGLVSRGRPAALLADVKLRESASGVGYVSGHSAVAFALATVLAPSLPRAWRPVAFALASVVAAARMYSGAHLPLDVVGGAGLGVLSGTLLRWAFGLGGEGLPVRVRA